MTDYVDHTRIANTLLSKQGEINDLKETVAKVEAERDGAYRERAHLVAHLASLYPSHIGPNDPSAPDWAVLTVETPEGQMSWHIAPADMNLFEHVPTTTDERGWDGHTTEEKYERLRQLTVDQTKEK